MKKIPLAAIATLIALSSAASAQSFDINSMPLGNIPTATDNTRTGAVAARKVFKREIERDGARLIQYYTLASDGSAVVISEEAH